MDPSYSVKPVTLYGGRKAPEVLDIVIVGCGLGGLAAAYCLGQAGHRITVLEAAPEIGEVGAGIQLGPNFTRLLIRWGLGEKLKEFGVIPLAFRFRRYEDGRTVGWTKWGEGMEREHGSPYYHIHRADLHRLLLELARPFMSLSTNSRVVSADPGVPAVTLESGAVIHADLIIGADGVKSTIREIVVGGPDKPVATGDAAYRAIIPTAAMLQDPGLKHLVDETEMTGWIGPKKHIIGYCIRGKKEYNLVMAHPAPATEESYTAEGSTDKMRADFAGWEPQVQKLLALVPSTLIWPLLDRAPLDTWIHGDGRIILLGDACHPMLPYRAQGSAMAVEDAAVLGNLLSRLTSRGQLTPLLYAYQSLRYPRATTTQAAARGNQNVFHLEDGPAQEARDASMNTAMDLALRAAAGEVLDDSCETAGNSNIWADRQKNRDQFGYDADEEVERWWARNHGLIDTPVGVNPRL
ncbi:FAD/NAD(P)-binding domain-containing protein [Pleurotus eryngii]|uniref:FAD/NAD(P)-binding domain-containing protein n=1 Tax=Pleurotus eryngii TaxID=5323 RepID=A0A9P6DCE9_PLEER|nr:FAD/NAD(P)-binding domain-containing protein [Pleurotus eryngii]